VGQDLKGTSSIVFGSGLCTVFLLFVLLSTVPYNAEAQNSGAFTTADTFSIPELTGSINFSTNGSYTSAILQNNTWEFNNLELADSTTSGNIKISAQNSHVTIYRFLSYQNTSQFGRLALVSFRVDGEGEQSFNLDLKLNRTTHQSEWSIIVPMNPDGTGSDFLPEGKLWHLLSDNTVVVDGVLGNVTIAYFGFGLNTEDNSNQSFAEQHSLAIATILIVAATIAISAVISFRVRRKP
jgi:hypothetical protein